MYTPKNIIALILVIIYSNTYLANETDGIPDLVVSALQNTKILESKNFAYTKTETKQDSKEQSSTVERFNPGSDPQWSLISSNGETPTQEEVDEYQQKIKEREEKRQEEDNGSDDNTSKKDSNERSFGFNFNDPDSIAESGTWKLLEENSETVVYGFKPKIKNKDDKKMLPFIDGKLTIDKNKQHVVSYHLSNQKPFKPAAVAKINEFKMYIEFIELEPQQFMPQTIEFSINGKAMFKRFVQKSKTELSDFEKVE